MDTALTDGAGPSWSVRPKESAPNKAASDGDPLHHQGAREGAAPESLAMRQIQTTSPLMDTHLSQRTNTYRLAPKENIDLPYVFF